MGLPHDGQNKVYDYVGAGVPVLGSLLANFASLNVTAISILVVEKFL